MRTAAKGSENSVIITNPNVSTINNEPESKLLDRVTVILEKPLRFEHVRLRKVLFHVMNGMDWDVD